MKYVGMICLIISTTGLGLHLSNDLKNKVNICHQLGLMSDLLMIDLGYTVTPVIQLFNKILNDDRLKNLGFISLDNIRQNKEINSCLSNSDNREISNFLYSLGKSDVNSQIKIITGFKEYINNREKDYNSQYLKNSKLYLSFGFFGGIIISLVLV